MAALNPRWIAAAVLLAAAAPPPVCSAAHDGVQICMTQQVCVCTHDPGGILSGRAPGWRWSCDILQECDSDSPADAGTGVPPFQGPVYLTPNMNMGQPPPR